MRKPPRTFLLVEAKLDQNDVPYLVADPAMPSRRVGIARVDPVPRKVDHFAEHFKPRAHVVDATNPLHRAHFEREAKAGTLLIHGQTQAKDRRAADAHFAALAKAATDAKAKLDQAEQAEAAAKAELAAAQGAAPTPPTASPG